MIRRMARLAVVGLLLLALPLLARAQSLRNGRYELGRRTRAVERAWLASADPARRGAVIAGLNAAVMGFFSGRLAAVAEQLDTATATLREAPDDPRARWAAAVCVTPDRALLDAGATRLGLQIATVYQPAGEHPALTVEWELAGAGGHTTTLPAEVTLDLPAGPAGDAALVFRVRDGQTILRQDRVGLSRVSNLEARLVALRGADPWPGLATLDQASFRQRVEMLTTLAAGPAVECDLPAAAWLQQAEAAIDAAGRGAPFWGRAPGDWTLAVPVAGRPWTVRAAVPAQPAPVVVLALHGAGGSANMFFEVYGDGLTARLCAERGWALVAPQVTSPTADYAALLAALRPVVAPQARRVIVLGHSLGGVATGLTAQQEIAGLAGWAVLSAGGAGQVGKLARLPGWVAAGEADFGRAGSQALVSQVQQAGGQVTWRQYPTEHLLVVAAALPELFAWCDQVVR